MQKASPVREIAKKVDVSEKLMDFEDDEIENDKEL